MTDPRTARESLQDVAALAIWDSEGGAGPLGSQEGSNSNPSRTPSSNQETMQLHVRIMALENLVLALLSTGSDAQMSIAREMAALIVPRTGFTQHPLTIHAATRMNDFVERAERFKKRWAPAP